MPIKNYQYSGGDFIWDFTSDSGPPVTITISPAPKDAGEFRCQKSADGCYDVLTHRPLTLPLATRFLELINACEVHITKAQEH